MMFWVLLKASNNACVVVFCLLEGGEEGATRLPRGALCKSSDPSRASAFE
jgi:hypothetical protein